MKIPKAHKLKSGLWQIRLYLNGQYIYIDETDKLACERKAMLIKAQCLNGEKLAKIEDFKLTEAIDRYIERRSNVLSPSTIAGYRNIQRNRLKAYMNVPLCRIDWQKAFNEEAAICSPKTVSNAYGLVASICKENGLKIAVKLPQAIPIDTEWLTPEQIPLFLDAIRGDQHELFALLALNSLRKSEILALKKDSIIDGVIKVHGSVVLGEEGMVYKETNKTSASRRDIPVLIPRITELVDAMPDGPLFKYMQSNFYVHINSACKRAGLPEVGVHGLRRSFASLAYYLGISERDLMLIGGWNDRETVHKHYVKISNSQVAFSADKLSAFFQKGCKKDVKI